MPINNNPIPEYPIYVRGGAGESAAGANLGGNVSRIDHYDAGTNTAVQILTTAADSEDGLINAIKQKSRSLNGAESYRIFGTGSDGQQFNLAKNTIPEGGIGLLVQIKEFNAGIASNSSFLNRMSQVMRETGRIIRVAPLRKF